VRTYIARFGSMKHDVTSYDYDLRTRRSGDTSPIEDASCEEIAAEIRLDLSASDQ